MTRRHLHVVVLVAVLSFFWSGCGGFHGILAPTLSSITPTTIAAGGADFTLTAAGSNFAPGTTILWNGASLPTIKKRETELNLENKQLEINNKFQGTP